MLPMPIADLDAICHELTESGERVKVLWQQPDTLAFVARGREYRSEFHIDRRQRYPINAVNTTPMTT